MAVSTLDLGALWQKYLRVHDALSASPDTALMRAYITQFDYRGRILKSAIDQGSMSDTDYANWSAEIDSFTSLARPSAQVVDLQSSSVQDSSPSSVAGSALNTIAKVFSSFGQGIPSSTGQYGSAVARSATPQEQPIPWLKYALIAGGLVLGTVFVVSVKRRRKA